MMKMQYTLVLILTVTIILYRECDSLSNNPLNLGGKSTISGNGTNAPFGTITGYASSNVPAYSNGNDSYISNSYNSLYGVYMGIEWQCVEYARRWLFLRTGCVFDSIEGAADMWTQLNEVQRVIDGKCFPLKKSPNGSPIPPLNQSLLIYQRYGKTLPYGHVAVIVDVLPGFIRVAEENYDAYYWGGNYSREIPYVFVNGSYSIVDDYPIDGWMSIVDDDNQLKPLDQSTTQKNFSSPTFICSTTSILHPISFSYFYLLSFFLIFI